MTSLQKEFYSLADPAYRAFTLPLIPGVDPEKVLGVRAPQLKKIAAQKKNTKEAKAFLRALPHPTFDENNLHAQFINAIRDPAAALRETKLFLPFVDNWATCDSLTVPSFKKDLPAAHAFALECLDSSRLYTVRFGIGVLMRYFLDGHFDRADMDRIASLSSEEYYLKMMVAWYFATALAKQKKDAMEILTSRRLEKWTHNKAIQKALESYRISSEDKAFLKTLKRTARKTP